MADTIYKLTHTGEQIDSAIDNAVRSDAQILTSEQQTQARTNIGAASAASAASAADLTTETNERITADTGVRGLTATVEATSTASKAYAIGAYFVYNGLLYKCTAEIAQGGTITPGTNCTATTAGAEISTLNQNLVSKLSMKILWTNPNSSPTAAFEPQTVTLSESIANYQMLMVMVFNVGGEFFITSMASGNLAYADGAGAGDRPYMLNGSTVAFGTGRYNSVNNNIAAVPYQIYGINGIC